MDFSSLRQPLAFLEENLTHIPHRDLLATENEWWQTEGKPISETIDRAGTPWVRMFDQSGKRVDQILFPHEYDRILKRGYRAGVIWRAFEEKSVLSSMLLIYNIAFYDPGICCPYTVSLATALSLAKYGEPALKDRYLPHMLQRDHSVWQGATWMTEIKGGSDLGANVETI